MAHKLLLRTLFLALLSLPTYHIVHAQDATPAELASAEKPLMVIRFTDKIVPYDGALKRTISQAERQIETPFYDIISVKPKDDRMFGGSDEQANSRVQHIAQSIQQAGINADRIRITEEESDQASYHEVHIFVR